VSDGNARGLAAFVDAWTDWASSATVIVSEIDTSRRTGVVGIFPRRDAIIRLAGGVLAE